MIKVQIESEDRLKRETWGFYLASYKIKLCLGSYVVEQRETPRHKYRVICGCRDSRLRRSQEMGLDDVPLPDEVKKAAIQQVIEQLEVVK